VPEPEFRDDPFLERLGNGIPATWATMVSSREKRLPLYR
jgi:hypothetical protein